MGCSWNFVSILYEVWDHGNNPQLLASIMARRAAQVLGSLFKPTCTTNSWSALLRGPRRLNSETPSKRVSIKALRFLNYNMIASWDISNLEGRKAQNVSLEEIATEQKDITLILRSSLMSNPI